MPQYGRDAEPTGAIWVAYIKDEKRFAGYASEISHQSYGT
jgi:hypothetical protein